MGGGGGGRRGSFITRGKDTSEGALVPGQPAKSSPGVIPSFSAWYTCHLLLFGMGWDLMLVRGIYPMDGGAWWAAVHGVAKSWTRLSDFTLTFHFHALEKEMATHSSVLAWRIPGTGEPGGLPSMGSHRVGHD